MKWTAEDIATLHRLRNVEHMSWSKVSTTMGRSVHACKSKGYGQRDASWTPLERAILKENAQQLARLPSHLLELNIPTKTAQQIRRKLRAPPPKQGGYKAYSPEELDYLATLGWKKCAELFPARSKQAWYRCWKRTI